MFIPPSVHPVGAAEFLFWMVMVIFLAIWVGIREDDHAGRR